MIFSFFDSRWGQNKVRQGVTLQVRLTPNTAHLLFQLVCKRYESKSILLTSNRPVAEWGMIFGDPTVATAILDRLLHHCTPVTIMGDSYRIKANLKSKLLDKN